MKTLTLAGATIALSITAYAIAQTTSGDPVAPFDGIELLGGADIEIVYGETHAFENTGDDNAWKLRRDGSTLVLDCPKPCRNKKRTAIITTPSLEDLELKGGGDIEVRGAFPPSNVFNIALMGGGDIDAAAITADTVNVAIMGGGDIDVSAIQELNASIMGGGEITYTGSPDVSKTILGGGRIKSK